MEALGTGDPDRIGGYWLAGRLGSGGQGVVYEAYDADGARYALKVLHATTDPGLRDRFRKEIAAARRVASFCTAKVIDADPDAARPYVVSEYVEGVNLRRAGRRFTGDDLHRLATAVATALTAVHEAGVVHRDLKPDNVLLGPDGPRVIDFGIARTAEMSLTASGAVAGTPAYMAPEILTGQRAGPPADVFAWGCVVVFAATGEDPFRADDLGAVMHRVLTHHPDLGALPPSVRPLVAAALDKDPDRRPSARDLLLALVGGPGETGTAGGLWAAGTAGGSGEAGPLGGFGADLPAGGDLLGAGRRAGALHTSGPADPALGALAEDAYATLGPGEREFVPELLLRLVTIDADGLETVRRVPADELLPERPETRRRILDAFGYLVTERDGEVAISRPAVLRAWPRLRSWVEADREGLPVLAEIGRAARVWDAHGRRDADLPQGSRLQAALGWAATGRRHLTLTPLERDFLAAAGGLTRRRARRRRLFTVALAVLLVLSLAGAAASVYQGAQVAEQRDRVAAERDQARGREIARVAGDLRTTDPVKAMLLSVAAWRLAPGFESRSSLTDAMYGREVGVFRPPAAQGAAVQAVSGDGRTLALVGERGVRVYEVATGRQVAEWNSPRLSGGVGHADLSGDGRLLAVTVSQAILVWETRTGRLAGSRSMPGVSPEGLEADFAGSGHLLALSGSERLWDVRRDRLVRMGWSPYETSFTVAPSGRIGATVNGGRVRVWRLPGVVEDRRFPRGCGGDVNVVSFSADSRFLICGGVRIELWDTATGRRARQAAEAHEQSYNWMWAWAGADPPVALDGASGIRLSDDNRLAAGHAGTSIWVWDVQAHREILTYRAPANVSAVWFTPDGRTLRYRLGDRIVGLAVRSRLPEWRLRGIHDVQTVSPDGRWLMAEPSDASRLMLWDVPGRRLAGTFPHDPTVMPRSMFDPTSRSVAVVYDDHRVEVLDVATRRRLWSHRLGAGRKVTGRAFSPDGRTFTVADCDTRGDPAADPGKTGDEAPETSAYPVRSDCRLHVWDTRTGREIRTVKLDTQVSGIVYLRDGRTLASAEGRLVDTATGRSAGGGYVSTPGGAVNVTADPTGRWLAVGDGERVTLWDIRNHRPLPPDLPVAARDSGPTVFSPRGDVLVTVDDNEIIRLWDTATRQPIGAGIDVHDADEYLGLYPAFTADGTRLRPAGVGGHVYELPVAPGLMAAEVCARAGRTLTRREWGEYLGGVPYRDVCAAP
ncbi:protein kinase domain-containing protein [Streptosporangium sandarakinum]|uniref:protein kinase domain-containing protein n=1 Tax=Streptosporangium sandarakinum TaxID=1260955 RepID=UPI003D8CAEFE